MGRGHEPVALLASRWANLQSQWKDLRAGWRDSAANQFDTSYWWEFQDALPPYLSRLEQALELLDDALSSNPVD